MLLFFILFHEAWGFWNLLEPGEVFLTDSRCTSRKLTGWSLLHSPAGCQWYCLYLYSTFISKCILLFYIPESTLLTWSQFPDPFLQCCGLPQSRVFPRTAIFYFAHVIDCGTSFLHQMALLWKLCGCERCPGSSHYPGSFLLLFCCLPHQLVSLLSVNALLLSPYNISGSMLKDDNTKVNEKWQCLFFAWLIEHVENSGILLPSSFLFDNVLKVLF